ncbi:hypothetical protein TQ38_028165 (plasmid) [Novosphingobium sp. P6W]|nr:hypothetical protein TQ38_028165 [Novosphingobium sp. P6W]
MTRILEVFGFGSFFRGAKDAKDIDILLIHQSSDPASCRFAIECKAHFQHHLPNVDVVMLSKTEEAQKQFIAKSGALGLGTIASKDSRMQVSNMARLIIRRNEITTEVPSC